MDASFFSKSRNSCFVTLIQRWAFCRALRFTRLVLHQLVEGQQSAHKGLPKKIPCLWYPVDATWEIRAEQQPPADLNCPEVAQGGRMIAKRWMPNHLALCGAQTIALRSRWAGSTDGTALLGHPLCSSILTVAKQRSPRDSKLLNPKDGSEISQCLALPSMLKVYLVQNQSFNGNHEVLYHLEIIFNLDAFLPKSQVINNAIYLQNKF